MISIKTVLAFAVSAAAITLATLSATSAQAAIVTGSVTGTWNDQAYGAFTLGDIFTATYSYDDTTISPSNDSDVDYVETRFTTSLLSLIVNSGSYSHTFDFTNGFSEFAFKSYALKAPTHTPASEKKVSVFGVERVGSVEQYFSASRASGLYDGVPTLSEGASAGVFNPDINPDTDHFYSYATTSSNVKFSPDPTAVPTPALLPSLVGLGIGVLRKKRAAVAETGAG